LRKIFLKNLEHFEQTTFFNWARINSETIHELDLLFSIPNGGKRNIRTAINLKMEGVKAGVPDIFFPVARKGFHGLFLEMKIKGGKVSDNQKIWHEKLENQFYLVKVVFGFEEAKNTILDYLGLL
jgi:hypothetical protein